MVIETLSQQKLRCQAGAGAAAGAGSGAGLTPGGNWAAGQ